MTINHNLLIFFARILATESLACDLVERDGWKWRGVGGGDGEGRISAERCQRGRDSYGSGRTSDGVVRVEDNSRYSGFPILYFDLFHMYILQFLPKISTAKIYIHPKNSFYPCTTPHIPHPSSSHEILRPLPTLRGLPGDILFRDLDIAGFAVDAAIPTPVSHHSLNPHVEEGGR